MKNNLIAALERKHMKDAIPEFSPGDTVRVNVKVREKPRDKKGERIRIQAYEGVVIAKRGSGINEQVVVRRVSHGIGIERTFMVHSPIIDGFEVLRRGDVRRAKLYYLRDRIGKAARVRERARRPLTEEQLAAIHNEEAATLDALKEEAPVDAVEQEVTEAVEEADENSDK